MVLIGPAGDPDEADEVLPSYTAVKFDRAPRSLEELYLFPRWSNNRDGLTPVGMTATELRGTTQRLFTAMESTVHPHRFLQSFFSNICIVR